MRHLLTRGALLGATAWFAATGVTGTVAWRAVSVLNSGGESTGLLSTAEVRTALGDAQTTATAQPLTTPTTPPDVVPSAAPGTEVARSWAVAGGTVEASCTGPVITLLRALPNDGWTVEVHSWGPDTLEVELHRGEQESVVRASCVGDEPVPEVSDVGDGDTGHATPVSPAPGPAPGPAPATATAKPSTPAPTSPTNTPTPSPHESEDDDHASPSPSESPDADR